ncbi:MAG: OsmC family protein [Chloroflexi bacterium]|nr:OsmC family protein [Chloroflexota bacterium]
MDAKVSWQEGLNFVGAADSGYQIKLASHSSPEEGVGPVEMVAIALAGCTAMDVISILQKKQQDVTSFDVKVHADRAADHPKVFTRATIEYVVAGRGVDEAAVLRAVELSLTKYCSVHAMVSKAFPIETHYSVYEDEGSGKQKLVKQGTFQHNGH